LFIRETLTKNKKTKTQYITHKLVESHRTEKGIRQRVIMSLGTLSLPKKRWRELATLIETRINGQQSFLEEDKEISSIADEVLQHNKFVKKLRQEQIQFTENSDMQLVDLNSVSTTVSRSLGAELVANAFWGRLNFDGILSKCGFDDKQKSLAKAVILGRLINPGSELSTWRWFQNQTSLIEMTDEDLEGIGKDSFYEIGDLLLENKEKIEHELFKKEQIEFKLQKKIYLYDLTNTYLEGSARNNKLAHRGHSKEKRTDCPLVTLALVVDEMGFPVFSQIYKGNQSEPQTLNDVLERLEKDSMKLIGDSKPILIMDRGIATKDNIDLIKDKEYPYTIINRQHIEKEYAKEFAPIKVYMETKQGDIHEGWQTIDKEGDVCVKKVAFDTHSHILVASMGRSEKEQSMDTLKETRFLEDMERLKKSFEKGNILMPAKVGERVGKLKSKYPTVGKYYEIELNISDDNKKVTAINLHKKPERQQRSIMTGCYVIETTQTDLSAAQVWKQYMLLNKVECAFADLKSELGLRPINHQTEERTCAHLFIGVLAYHLIHSIESVLKSNGDTREWKTIKDVLATHQRSTVILKGNDHEVFHIRVSGTPEICHNSIYKLLKINDPLRRKKKCVLSRL
jgi:hypothetical protein